MPGGRHGAPEGPGRERPSAGGAAVAERTRASGAPVDPGRPAGGLRPAALSLGAAWLIRGLRSTVRLRHHGDARLRGWEERGEHFILAFWHRHLLLMPYAYRGRRISVLISRSRDGELIARTVARLGIDASRGSSSRGGATGLRELLRKAAAGCDLAFTPDGPRGPVGAVMPGVILAAAATGLPVQPVALAASRCRRLRSWDRFVVPLPLATVHFVYGEPLWVPRRPDLDAFAGQLRERLDGAEAAAERAARGAPETGPSAA
jgi:lysophospholipid acyltransferase (LPLAT)-like uncharacterized protein